MIETIQLYAGGRRHRAPEFTLRDEEETPPERFLQAIWFHQRVARDRLTALDGRRIAVLHPGFWNRAAGPDFRQAVLQWEGEPPCSGDVEIDLQSSGWHAHGHDQNPAFKKVLLHVVWESDHPTHLPTLPLKALIDSPLHELRLWLGGDAAQTFPDALLGQCCAPLRDLAEERLTELLRQAALVRLQSKANQFLARAREAGWEQALWEGLFRALGYKQNIWPMQRLAELRARLVSAPRPANLLAWQARLLGVGGLLPTELTRSRSAPDNYLRRLWDIWWRERQTFHDCVLPRHLWCGHGLRPANHPARRLALAAHWLAADDVPARLDDWCKKTPGKSDLPATLLEVLNVPRDEFWSWHWTLRSRCLTKPQPLLGAMRATDLAMNAVLPCLWMRAAEGKRAALQRELEQRYLQWPAAEDNAVLRLARQRLLGGRKVAALRTAAAQQGLLQIVRDFCEHSNALCTECQFPEVVRRWLA
jgi:hypothetical protein